MEAAAGVAEESEVAMRLAVGAVHDPHDIIHMIHNVRNIDERLVWPKECQAVPGSPIERFGRHGERYAHSQELIDLSVGDARLDPPAQLRLLGKGHKMRAVPLMESTVQLLQRPQYRKNTSIVLDNPIDSV
jgi:hypothetical protein